MRQEKFLNYIKDGNLRFKQSGSGDRMISNTFKGILRSSINPNPNMEVRSYFVKYNPSVEMYFLCTHDGYIENLTHMGQAFKWNFWVK